MPPLTLDPHKEFAEKNHILLQQIYEGLVRFDAEGRIEPALAVSWTRIDALRMRFKLREGVRFHNGDPFTANSVRFTVERYLDPKTGFPALGFISSLDRAEVVDELTVDLITHYPDGLLLNRLAGFILIVPEEHVRKAGDTALNDAPVGTGPFVFDHRKEKEEIALVRNKNYWMKDAPKVNELIFRFVPWERQVEDLLNGKIDIVTELPGTQTAQVMKSKVARVIKRDTLYQMIIPISVSSGPLTDVRVRKALNYALNKEEIIRYDLLGNGKILAGVAMKGKEGYNPDLTPYPFDPKKARALLKEAGYDGNLKLRMLFKEQGARAAGIIRRQFEAVGIGVSAVSTDDSRVIQDIGLKTWDLVVGGCPDPMVHSYFILCLILHSRSPYSIADYPEFDRRLEDMATTLDSEDRNRKARALDRFVYDESLTLFTYQRIKTYGVNRKVKFYPSVTGMPHFFSIEKAGDAKPAVSAATP
ncbi:MAG: hypothetical protein A2901_06235 [Elusimicrobia bacterium RIFCSPLOWO2_01_FULL_54_10]|nr:MAG: hypothetical protein A2901_06235 [Elusimicrobia bacterium RIFCSPLOWO2_01_FULL_54_10]